MDSSGQFKTPGNPNKTNVRQRVGTRPVTVRYVKFAFLLINLNSQVEEGLLVVGVVAYVEEEEEDVVVEKQYQLLNSLMLILMHTNKLV